jgi:carboxyl-terminal processing protease
VPSGRCIQALDYSHKREDGSVGKIPDSLVTEFKTRNARKVYDGGGISPDIKVKPLKLSSIAAGLLTKSIIFDYATEYFLKHKSILPAREFELTDTEYNEFIDFLSGKEFDYESKSEDMLNKLKETAKKERYYDDATAEFEALYKKLAHDRKKDLQFFREEIKKLIAEEIVSRYYYQRGAIEYSFGKDPEIQKALEVLRNQDQYRALLNDTSKKIDDREPGNEND